MAKIGSVGDGTDSHPKCRVFKLHFSHMLLAWAPGRGDRPEGTAGSWLVKGEVRNSGQCLGTRLASQAPRQCLISSDTKYHICNHATMYVVYISLNVMFSLIYYTLV